MVEVQVGDCFWARDCDGELWGKVQVVALVKCGNKRLIVGLSEPTASRFGVGGREILYRSYTFGRDGRAVDAMAGELKLDFRKKLAPFAKDSSR